MNPENHVKSINWRYLPTEGHFRVTLARCGPFWGPFWLHVDPFVWPFRSISVVLASFRFAWQAEITPPDGSHRQQAENHPQ